MSSTRKKQNTASTNASIASTISTMSGTQQQNDRTIDYSELLKSKFDRRIEEDDTGKKYIKNGSTLVESQYHSYLSNPSCCNTENKRQVKRAFYGYILENDVKVCGGKFDKPRWMTRILYYCT
jgi:hypothetical protein